MATLSLRNIAKQFGSVDVLKNVSVDVADGEFVVLVGPSGCGKSTLLRLIAGLEAITSGEIHIGGRCVNNLQAKERDVAMVFQSYALYPHMTVAQNMGFSLKIGGVSAQQVQQRVATAAETLGLTPLLDRLPKQLSGGQRQRVAMGRAIVRSPQIFLFDEPLSNLDARLRLDVRVEIRALQQRLKATMVYVTHDQVEAMTMADKIVIMDKGRIEQVGTPLELFDSPVNVFVAGFIGSPTMNLVRGRRAGSEVISESGLKLPLTREWNAAQGQEVVYGIRPEHLHLEGELRAQVLVVEPTGSETTVVVSSPAGNLSCVLRDRTSLRPGDSVGLGVRPGQEHVFDAASGARLSAA